MTDTGDRPGINLAKTAQHFADQRAEREALSRTYNLLTDAADDHYRRMLTLDSQLREVGRMLAERATPDQWPELNKITGGRDE